MSSEITGSDFWQPEERRAAWHRLQGGIIGVGELPSELWNRVGHPDVERAPLAAWSEAAQAWLPVDTNYAILRGPTRHDSHHRTLGIVSGDYTLVQHRELAQKLDTLVQEGWQAETAAVLHEGAQCFMSFNAGGYVVNQDEITKYWVASVRHAASAVTLHQTSVRTVCANTFVYGAEHATQKISIPHYSTVKQELGWAVDVLAQTREQDRTRVEELTALGATPMDDSSFNAVLAKVYPLPAPPRRMQAIAKRVADTGGRWDGVEADVVAEYQKAYESYESKRALVERLQQAVAERTACFNEERPQFANTAWAVWNSITEIESHRRGKNIGHQVLFGERGEALGRGYRELVKIAAAR
jgi:hypothetical protein